MSILCSQILSRVAIQWSMTLTIVPLMSQYVIMGIIYANRIASDFWADVEGVAFLWDEAMKEVSDRVPSVAVTAWDKLIHYRDIIPDSILETLPVTLMSCVLGCLAVPFLLFKIDDFFKELADNKKGRKKGKAPIWSSKKGIRRAAFS